MITDEQILQIAQEHLYILTSVNEWYGKDGDILNFARAIYEIGNENGWESRADADRAKDRDTLTVSQPTNPTRIPIEQSINRVIR